MKEVYNTELTSPTARDMKIYERYVNIGSGQNQNQNSGSYRPPQRPSSLFDPHKPGLPPKSLSQCIDIFPISAFKLDSSSFVEPPPVSRQAKDIYSAYVNRGLVGAGPVSEVDKIIYKTYVNKLHAWIPWRLSMNT